MKTKIKLNSPVSMYRDGKEYIPGVLPPYDSRFLKVLKQSKGHVPKSVYDAAVAHRIECENYSFAAKIENHDHIRLAQKRDMNATEKEIEILNAFIDEMN